MIENLVRRVIGEAVKGAPARLRHTKTLTHLRTRRRAAAIEALERRQLLSAWASTTVFDSGASQMYAVYNDESGAPGVMFNASIDGGSPTVFYKKSDTSSQPTPVSTGWILGAANGIQMSGGTSPDDGVVFAHGTAPDTTTLYWASDNSGSFDIGSFPSGTEISNICGIGNAGFYFSTWYSGAMLHFAEHTSSGFTLHSYDMTDPQIGSWHDDTRISWITAVPGNSGGYDVMFSGDRCYREGSPVTRYTDGRQLWGMLSTNTAPTIIDADVGDEITHPCPWYDAGSPLYGLCPWEMIITNTSAAVGGKLYFATTSDSLAQLWVSNGTPIGTAPIDNEDHLPWYISELDEHGQPIKIDVPLRQISGIDGYVDDNGTPQVFLWRAEVNPSCLWVTHGTINTEPTPIGGFDVNYCVGPKIPGKNAGDRPFVIVKDTADPDFGTAYFTAAITNENGQTPYELYKIARDATSISAGPLWDGGLWSSGLGPVSACKWLTAIDGKLYFRGGQPANENNMRLREMYVYDSSVGSVTLTPVPDIDVSWLVYDDGINPGRLYYFSLYGTSPMNTRVKLCWWDLS